MNSRLDKNLALVGKSSAKDLMFNGQMDNVDSLKTEAMLKRP